MDKQALIKFLKVNAQITWEALEEDVSVKNYCFEDKEAEERILNRLKAGELSAWFCAHVVAEYAGFIGDDYLGCCSYKSLSEFEKEKGGYFEQMITKAISELADRILDVKSNVDELVRKVA